MFVLQTKAQCTVRVYNTAGGNYFCAYRFHVGHALVVCVFLQTMKVLPKINVNVVKAYNFIFLVAYRLIWRTCFCTTEQCRRK